MAARLHNKRIGRFVLSAGLRADGGRSVEVKSDYRDGGPVVLALITPGPIVMVFHVPTLDALLAQYESETHPAATLTGGSVPEHVPGAYPNLSCCDGPVVLVESEGIA
jgi:hypothetical protein